MLGEGAKNTRVLIRTELQREDMLSVYKKYNSSRKILEQPLDQIYYTFSITIETCDL